MLLNSVYAYPDDLVINLEVEFLRVDNAYAFCFNNCQWLSSGYYSPNNNTIGIPDSGLLESTFHHEITHAIDFNNPGLINEFIDKTGCHQNPADPNGNYLYTEYPYRDYGKYNCNEGLAVSCGEEYMDPDMSCYMKFVRPIQYNFCRDNIFSGKEFCVPPRG